MVVIPSATSRSFSLLHFLEIPPLYNMQSCANIFIPFVACEVSSGLNSKLRIAHKPPSSYLAEMEAWIVFLVHIHSSSTQ